MTALEYIKSLDPNTLIHTEEEALENLIKSHSRMRDWNAEYYQRWRNLSKWKKRISIWLKIV